MKRMRRLICILIVLVLGSVSSVFAASAHQFDVKSYDKIAKKNIGRVVSGNIDADKMVGEMEKLVQIGIDGCKEYIGEAETPPEEVKMMKIIIENADKMAFLTLNDIEAQWHDGGVFKANGINIDKFGHFAKVMCYTDAVVHPATAIICLKEYKKSKNEDLLEQMKDELAEVREHLKHLE